MTVNNPNRWPPTQSSGSLLALRVMYAATIVNGAAALLRNTGTPRDVFDDAWGVLNMAAAVTCLVATFTGQWWVERAGIYTLLVGVTVRIVDLLAVRELDKAYAVGAASCWVMVACQHIRRASRIRGAALDPTERSGT